MFIKKSSLFAITVLLSVNPLQQALAETVISKDMPVIPIAASNEFTIGATFLRASGSNDYAVLVSPFDPAVATPILSPSWQVKGINPALSPGFFLNFRHDFIGDTDINFYWSHLRTSDNASFGVNRNPPPFQQFAGPVFNIGPDGGTTNNPAGTLKNYYDALNVEFGKHFTIEQNLKLRVFTGLSGVWIKQKNIANFAGVDPILGPYTFNMTTQGKYNGGGLRLGLDGEYQIPYHLSIVSMLAGTLFIGEESPSTNTSGTGSILSAAGIPVNNQSISHNGFVQIIPAIDAKLGVKYFQEFNGGATCSIEAGYLVSYYANAVQNYVPSTLVPGSLGIVSGSIFLQSLIKTTESFTLDGPYISFSIKI